MGKPLGSRNLSEDVREAIRSSYNDGVNMTQLARIHKTSVSTIHACIRNIHRTKSSGRPKVTDKLMDKRILNISCDNPKLTSSDIVRDLHATTGTKVSQTSVT